MGVRIIIVGPYERNFKELCSIYKLPRSTLFISSSEKTRGIDFTNTVILFSECYVDFSWYDKETIERQIKNYSCSIIKNAENFFDSFGLKNATN